MFKVSVRNVNFYPVLVPAQYNPNDKKNLLIDNYPHALEDTLRR
jgi:hypothetical protein